MKSLANILRPAKILFPLILGASLLSNPAKAQKISFLKEFNMECIYYEEKTKIENTPLEIRDVPKHPDDNYAYNKNVAPIDNAKIKMGTGLEFFSLKFGGKLSLFNKNVQIKTGAGIGIELNLKQMIAERNYTNYPGTSQRGVGAALTFYGVGKRYVVEKNGFMRPFLFSELNMKIIPLNKENKYINKMGLGAGYEIFIEKVVMINGWDRYNLLETWKRYNLCDLVIGRPYISINLFNGEDVNFKLTGGFDYILKKKETDIGKETKINYNPGWFAGFKFNVEF